MELLSAEQLIDQQHHAWDELMQMFTGGDHTYIILPVDRDAGKRTLERLQISTRSYLGAIAYETGGILVDHGWIKVLGSGAAGIYGSLCSWNGLHDQPSVPEMLGMLTVAYDAAGGFFALDGGKFGHTGHIYYFAPDTLEWESTELAYSGFIQWLIKGDLQQFYEPFRWAGWQQEAARLGGERVFSYYPPLWTKEGSGTASYKSPIPVGEAWNFVLEQFQDAQTATDHEPAPEMQQQEQNKEQEQANEQGQPSLEQHIDRIEKHYRICFPLDYLNRLDEAVTREYQYADAEGHIDWSIHFSKLDEQFIANNEELVAEMNPDPQRIIPFAWSVSSGNYYLFDYRYHPDKPAVLLMEHEEAIVREDAEAEAEHPEQVQEMLDGNVRLLADHFEEFVVCLKEQESDLLFEEQEHKEQEE
ncbi:DUF2625 family protein [Paenibacillus sp. SGZ-1009]|uniref:DUF2625 family protein n=1 Tax=Paenibacillus campi TaxID=3106031 RepID=UPI002AFEE513|nr:DUF2625 family protein [Paenibacillus sp. SGZ-1009]